MEQGIRKKPLNMVYPKNPPKGGDYCWCCYKSFKPNSKRRMIHIIDGGRSILHPSDYHRYIPDGGDCGGQEIGITCAKKFGMEWSV